MEIIGKILANRYHVESFLGRGGMADVYKVWDNQRSVYLALKMLRQDLAEDKVFLRRFQREAQTLEKLQHPNIVRFYGIERDGHRVFMLMENIKGTTLQRTLFTNDDTIPDFKLINHVIQSVCAALHYAHSMGMVHCDIKPGNIMIDETGKVLLTDFGIARMTDAATATMVGFGTPAYMAPELVRCKDPSPQSDIYSLGVVLYEMVTGGERPFTGEQAQTTGSTSEKVRWEQIHLDPPSPRKYNPTITPELEATILMCLRKTPEARFSNVLEVLRAFKTSMLLQPLNLRENPERCRVDQNERHNIVDSWRGVETGAGVGGLEESESRPKERFEKKRLPAWLPWGLLGILAVGIILILAFGRGGGDEIEPSAVVDAQIEFTEEVSQDYPTTESQTNTLTATEKPTSIAYTEELLTPTATLGIGSTLINEKDGAELVFIPDGEFLMGSEEGDSDESPEHIISLAAYWIYKHEVTNQQFADFINDTGYVTDAERQGWSWVFNDQTAKVSGVYWAAPEHSGSNLDGRLDHPVVHISYGDASAYCHWVGGRLPTEAEWEKAARGTDGIEFPWGSTQPTCTNANFIGCEGRTLPNDSHSNGASPYDVMDMAGNVWEWVSDWYSSSFYGLSPINNPQGPVSGEMYVIRGGGWTSEIDYLRVTNRYWSKANDTSNDHGFRCVFPEN